MGGHPQAKIRGTQGSLAGQMEQHGVAWHRTTTCYPSGATGGIWHHPDNGCTDLYSSQDGISAVKTP